MVHPRRTIFRIASTGGSFLTDAMAAGLILESRLQQHPFLAAYAMGYPMAKTCSRFRRSPPPDISTCVE